MILQLVLGWTILMSVHTHPVIVLNASPAQQPAMTVTLPQPVGTNALQAITCKWIAPLQANYQLCANGTTREG